MKFLYRLFLLLFLISPGLYAEDLIMEMSPNPVGKGDRFSIDFFINYEDMRAISVEPPILPDGISLYKGPYKRPYWLELPDGSSRKKTLITYTYSTSKEGRFEIGSFLFTLGDKVFSTDPHLIRIGLYKNRKLYMPYKAEWSVSSDPFYEGQAIPIVLEVKDLEEVMLFNDIVITNPDMGFLESVNNLGQVGVSTIGSTSLYTIPVRGFIFTPTSSGTLKLPSSTVTARGISSESKATSIEILEIPSEISSTGAIGKFNISSRLVDNKLVENENLILHVKAEGQGNLNYFQFEPPYGQGLTLVNTAEISEYHSSFEGYTGYRETIYTFISDSPGDKRIIIPAFPFLDPDTNIIYEGSQRKIPFQIDANINSEINNKETESLPFSPKKVDGRGFSSTERYKDPSSYLWLLPGPLVFLIFFLTGRKKTILGVSIIFIAASGQVVTNQAVDIGIVQYERGEYHSSIESFQQASTELKNNSYLSYNLALAYYQLGDYGKSIYEARNAFYHDPFNSEYRNLVNYVELKGEILYPIDLSFNLYPDAFLFLLMILVNISAFIGVIYLVSSKNIYFISSVLLLGLSVMAIGGLGFSVIQKDRQVGIIIQDSVPVKKIPIQEGETILDMKSGESVLIKGDSNDYLFINTGTGIKGWIDKSDLIIIKD
ncbi:MAG: hypothetical protein PF693_09570 [Spirochaetia bacterium]|jgi:tetratricopeptide (TPR) repeat protein|nr:hypothetical protein [Spirochaetia bacterium]